MHLPPVEPTKIVCVHLNYESRRAEFRATLGPAPTYFHKPISSLNAHGGEIVRPPRCRFLNYEGEIAHRDRRALPPHRSRRGRRLHPRLHDRQRLRAARLPRHRRRFDAAREGLATRCARSGRDSWTDWDFHGKRIETRVNGDVVQAGNTDEMIWDMHYLVADIARTITLEPGDVILSGTPGELAPGAAGRRRRGRGRRARRAAQHDRRGLGAHARRRRRAAERERGSDLDRVRRRLGVPRRPCHHGKD